MPFTAELTFGQYQYGTQTESPNIEYKTIQIGSSVLDTQNIITDGFGSAPNRGRGWFSGAGSIVPGTSAIYSGAAITVLDWEEQGGAGGDSVYLTIAGIQVNAGWTTMRISGPNGVLDLLRSAATFSNPVDSTWSWDNLGIPFASNPFGDIGASVTVSFY